MVTAGNASQLSDGAPRWWWPPGTTPRSRGIKPLAEIVGLPHRRHQAGVDHGGAHPDHPGAAEDATT